MDFMDLIQKRYSVRAYKPDPIEPEKLQSILEAARLAPSASNRQPYQIIVIQTKGREAELNRIYSKDWFVQAPVVLAIVATRSTAWVRKYDQMDYAYADATIAMDYMILAAHDLGLGTCWIAAFDPAPAREILGLPDDVEPVAFTPLGYAADEQGMRKRKELAELVRYERW